MLIELLMITLFAAFIAVVTMLYVLIVAAVLCCLRPVTLGWRTADILHLSAARRIRISAWSSSTNFAVVVGSCRPARV
jgi:hypothetical protein